MDWILVFVVVIGLAWVGVIAWAVGLLFGFIGGVLSSWLFSKLTATEARKVVAQRSVEKRKGNEDELEEALGEIATAIQQGVAPVDAVKAASAAHPAVVAKLGMKLLRQGLDLKGMLGDLLGGGEE